MKTKYNILVLAFISFWLIIGLSACGDDSTSSGNEENCNSLTLPTALAPVQISVDYFNTNSFPNEEQYMTYQQVKSIAMSGNGFLAFSGNAALISTFLSLAPSLGIQPESEGGNCVWNVNLAEDFPQFGLNLNVTVIANQSNDRVNWEVLLTGELSDGQNVDNFLFLDGFTSNDESTGEWNGYDPENPGSSAYTYTWDIESENDYELNFNVFQEGTTVGTVNYVRNGVENEMFFSSEGQITADIYWNEETDSGSIEQEGEPKMCYEDFENSECS